MGWVALKMLTGDRAKFSGIVLGLTFAALLVTQQGSIFCGLMLRTAAQITDISGADLWVMDANVRYIDDVKPMIEDNLYRVRGVDGVLWAVPLYKGMARAKVTFNDRVDRRTERCDRDGDLARAGRRLADRDPEASVRRQPRRPLEARCHHRRQGRASKALPRPRWGVGPDR